MILLALPALLLPSLPDASAQEYRFPTSDADYGAFYPTAYKDHGGVSDWNCGDLTYSGHGGSDFGGGSWEGMDAGRDIVAAAVGTVVDAHDGEYDRCSTGDCSGGGGYGNYVKITHADGKSTIYGHLKQYSVAVSAGQTVSCGQKLGEMGSSGYSTGPHVHFEVREASNSSSDPFDGPCSAPPIYWVDQGAYAGLPALICDDVAPCSVIGALHCGEAIATSNTAAGSTTSHGAYGSCTEYSYSGSEVAYELTTPLDEPVTIRLTGLGADLDLMVLTSDTCDGSGCIGASTNPDGGDEAVAFTATANARYILVIDGWEGATSSFTLSAECTGAPPEDTGETGQSNGGDSGETDTDSGDPYDTSDPGPGDSATLDTDGPGAVVEPGGLAACGCTSSGPGSVRWLGLVGLLLARRRSVTGG